MKEIYTNPRIYLSLLFFIVVLYQLKDLELFQNSSTFIALFIIVPLIIYLFVKYLFNKKG